MTARLQTTSEQMEVATGFREPGRFFRLKDVTGASFSSRLCSLFSMRNRAEPTANGESRCPSSTPPNASASEDSR